MYKAGKNNSLHRLGAAVASNYLSSFSVPPSQNQFIPWSKWHIIRLTFKLCPSTKLLSTKKCRNERLITTNCRQCPIWLRICLCWQKYVLCHLNFWNLKIPNWEVKFYPFNCSYALARSASWIGIWNLYFGCSFFSMRIQQMFFFLAISSIK